MNYLRASTYAGEMEVKADASHSGILSFGGISPSVNIHVPQHIAEATSAAFNRAAQAVVQPDGSFRYEAGGHVWLISLDPVMRKVWQYQSDEITGDEDPSWMSGTGDDLMQVMNLIDGVVDENLCPACEMLVGDRKMNLCADGKLRCWDCDVAWQEREASLHEAAMDDKAHAARDMARGI